MEGAHNERWTEIKRGKGRLAGGGRGAGGESTTYRVGAGAGARGTGRGGVQGQGQGQPREDRLRQSTLDARMRRVSDDMENVRVGQKGMEENDEDEDEDEQGNTHDHIYA